ncbi:hypothetical protein ANN_24125 [Periplaneta americana]|uniref:Uncharacterized protein n=1 Tax=Periplaneta americana TaxID=6978 RepID=A0ABQ8S288_PERAM|nr:hypothetical protein ANN_24125 [Periplaneta americana]
MKLRKTYVRWDTGIGKQFRRIETTGRKSWKRPRFTLNCSAKKEEEETCSNITPPPSSHPAETFSWLEHSTVGDSGEDESGLRRKGCEQIAYDNKCNICNINMGGMKVGGRRIKCIRFDDGVALLAEETILWDMLLELNDSCGQYGMKINANRTKTIVIRRKINKVVHTCGATVSATDCETRWPGFESRSGWFLGDDRQVFDSKANADDVRRAQRRSLTFIAVKKPGTFKSTGQNPSEDRRSQTIA